MSFWTLGIAKTKRLLTSFREWLTQPNEQQLLAYQILEAHTEQNRALVETVRSLAEAQTRQAEAFQRSLQAIIDVWNQPPPERTTPIRTFREQELLRDLQREANGGYDVAKEMLDPKNAQQLEEYLSFFNES